MSDVKIYEWHCPDPELTAIHEAGHAYIAWKEGVKMSSVFITKPYLHHKGTPRQPEGGVNIRGGWIYDKKVAIPQYKIAVAGMAAERHCIGLEADYGSEYDMTLAADMANIFQLDAAQLSSETYQEVKDAKDHIIEFAKVLEKKRRLTGKQIVRTFKRICSAPKDL